MSSCKHQALVEAMNPKKIFAVNSPVSEEALQGQIRHIFFQKWKTQRLKKAKQTRRFF